jgi:electron transfer flavoprotein alpha subunit
MAGIIAVVESFNGSFKKSSLEAVSYAHAVASGTGSACIAIVLGEANDLSLLGKAGAEKVLHINQQINFSDTRTLAKCIAGLAIAQQAKAIIIANTSTGKSLAGRLAIRMNGGCATGVTSLPEINGDEYTISRSVYAGKALAKVKLLGSCKILTISAGAVPLKSDGSEVTVEITSYDQEHQVKIIDTKRMSGKTPLPEAELVVSAGRGLKAPENWGIVEELADALGATTACSRPVADAHWRPHHEHVGQTGIAIKPKLYIALGISGAIQHLAGVNNSKVIVVVNKDPEAPFFKAADYGIVGDVFEVVPRLTAAVKKIKAN